MLTLTDHDFQRLYTYIKKNYGIDLSKKKQLIVSRLSNSLSSQGYRDFSAYVDEITSGKDSEMVTAMLNKLTTNYTYFLREEEHFKYLWDVILPDLEKKHAKDKNLAIWSAGCSSQKILNTAIHATYGEEGMSSLPPAWRQKYFVKAGADTYTVSPAIKQNVIFRTFNLMDTISFKRKFDLIFCRNVMIYFDQATKDALVHRFYNATVPGGHLLIAPLPVFSILNRLFIEKTVNSPARKKV